MSKKELVVGTSLVERPIAMLVQTAGRYASELHLQMDNKNINLKIQYKKKAIVRYGIVTILTIIFIIGSLFWGSIDIQFQDNSFTIQAQGWSDYTVDYTKIDSISYEENLFQNSNDYRTNGLGNFKYAM